MPTGGMSGTAFFIAALKREGLPPALCMDTMLLSLVAYYGACLIAAVVTLLLLGLYHDLQAWILLVVAAFALVSAGIPIGALWLRSWSNKPIPRLLMRVPGLSGLIGAFADAPDEMLQVVGVQVSPWLVFPSFVVASMIATIGPIPLGLGTFQVTCVSMLGIMGVPVEAALASTLLLRGFTVWLPMAPGLWLAKRTLVNR